MKRKPRAWIKALRSGKFKQTDQTLYDPDENAYCCLGVKAKIGKKGGLIDTCGTTIVEYNTDLSECPDYLGLNTPTGEFILEEIKFPKRFPEKAKNVLRERAKVVGHLNLIDLNDICKLSFTQIANFIELNWKVL